jgi:porin
VDKPIQRFNGGFRVVVGTRGGFRSMVSPSRFVPAASIFSALVAGVVVIAAIAEEGTNVTAVPTDRTPLVTTAYSSEDSPSVGSENAESEVTAPLPPSPFGGPLCERTKLTGDWLSWRPALAEDGITFDLSTTQFYQGVTSGGLDQSFPYGGRNDYFLNLDGEKLGLGRGAFVTLHGESRYGDSVNFLTGAMMPANMMLAVPKPTGSVTALSGVKFTQFLSENMLVYAGKINAFDDFKQPLTGAGTLNGFQNTAMMFNPVYARTIPYSSYAAGFASLKNHEPVFAAAVFDTNSTPTVSGFDRFFDNGATTFAQLNLPTHFFSLPGHQGVTGTYSTGTYNALTPSAYLDPITGLGIIAPEITGSWCMTYNFDQAFYVSPDNPHQRWGLFGNLGLADGNPSPIRWFASTGISGASPIAGRSADSFGVGYFYVGVSETLKNLAPNLLPLKDEQGVELYYNVAVTPWCHITPDLQVIVPYREIADTALLFGVRAKIDF